MLKNMLLLVFIALFSVYLWLNTTISNPYYMSKGIKAYNSGNYILAIKELEQVISTDKNNKNARFYYVRSLSKADSTYKIQKKIFEMANSDVNDESKEFAKSQSYILKRKLLAGVEDNYIYNAISGKEIIRWDIKSFPLKVYFKNTNEVPSYYKDNIDKALSQWTSRTNFIKFEQVNNEANADIYIEFKDFDGTCSSQKCYFAIAYTEPNINNNKLKRMNLIFHKTNPAKQQFSSSEIYNTAIHEIGHTLGIMGHSDNPDDAMYSNNDKAADIYSQYRSDFQYLSTRDLKTLALLYRLSPTITNTNDLENEHFYYAPLILGNEDELLNKKLAELKNI